MQRRISTWAPLVALLVACGAPPPPAPPPVAHETPAPPDPDRRAGPEAPPPPAALTHLEHLPPRQLEAAVGALSEATAAAAEAAADPAHPAWGWLQLRLARAALDRADDAGARQRLDLLDTTAPTGPLAAAATAERARLTDDLPTSPRTVGLLLPLSGPYGAIGRGARRAVELAFEQRPGVRLIVADTQGDADEAARQLEALVRDHGVVAVLGPVGQLEGRAAAEAASRLRVPLMTLSTAPQLTGLGPYVFRHRLTYGAQARFVARHACERLQIKRFAILYPDNEYGRALMRAFWAAVESCGGEIRGAQAYPEDAKDFATPIKKLIGRHHLGLRTRSRHWEALNRKARDKALHVPPIVDFEGLYIPDGGARAGLILPFLKYWDVELRTHPWQDARALAAKYEGEPPPLVQIIGASGFHSPAFVRRAGELAHNSLFVDAFWPEANDAAQTFAEAYQARAGRPADALAAHAHDAALMVIRAAAGGGDRRSARDALAATRHQGVFGPTRVLPSGDVGFWPVLLTVIPGQGIALRNDGAPAHDEDAP